MALIVGEKECSVFADGSASRCAKLVERELAASWPRAFAKKLLARST